MEFRREPLPNNYLRMVGFDQTYENADPPEVVQSYDPGLIALCLNCEQPLTESRDRVEFKVPERPDRKYFYLVHKECHAEENAARAIKMVKKQKIIEGLHRNAI